MIFSKNSIFDVLNDSEKKVKISCFLQILNDVKKK